MWPYLHGDPRIGRIGKSKRALASAWCRREYANLLKASKAGIACPKPLGFEENVLVMEFIGKNFVPAPRLIDLEKDRNFIKKVVTEFKKIKKAGLVHGDFSAYNILVWRKKPVFIDWSHAVLLDHPLAKKLLERDMENLAKLMEL
jgi:RIO kinase 1